MRHGNAFRAALPRVQWAMMNALCEKNPNGLCKSEQNRERPSIRSILHRGRTFSSMSGAAVRPNLVARAEKGDSHHKLVSRRMRRHKLLWSQSPFSAGSVGVALNRIQPWPEVLGVRVASDQDAR